MAWGEFCKRIIPMTALAMIHITDQKKPMVSPVLSERYNSRRKKGMARNRA
jgi:hypothetical protein